MEIIYIHRNYDLLMYHILIDNHRKTLGSKIV